MVLFSTSSVASLTFPVRHVVLGQYLGISLLIAISALGSLIPLLVPPYLIGLLGIVPMAIGVRRLVQIIRKDGNTSIISMPKKSNNIHRHYLPFLVVAAITLSNGGDNLCIYPHLLP